MKHILRGSDGGTNLNPGSSAYSCAAKGGTPADSHPKGQSDAARANEPLSGWTYSDRLAVASPASINALHDNLHPVRRRPARVEIQASLGPSGTSAASGRIHCSHPNLPKCQLIGIDIETK
jgi:hypothetical protein